VTILISFEGKDAEILIPTSFERSIFF